MILVGRYRSPFARRVAISLRCLGIDYEHRPVTAWTHLAEVRELNPVGRVPALVLDSGEVLFDSAAILDYLDHRVGAARALVPMEEPQRHAVLRVVACAMGALEKVVAALYENTMHPPEKVHPPWVAHNQSQARSALAWLDARAGGEWLVGTRLSQADITTVAMYDFTRIVDPALVVPEAYPRLAALAERCDALPAFALTLPAGDVDQANPALPAGSSRP